MIESLSYLEVAGLAAVAGIAWSAGRGVGRVLWTLGAHLSVRFAAWRAGRAPYGAEIGSVAWLPGPDGEPVLGIRPADPEDSDEIVEAMIRQGVRVLEGPEQ